MKIAERYLSEGLESFISRTNQAITVDQVFHILERRLAELDIEYFAYVLFFPNSSQIQLCLTNYPQSWAQYYLENRFGVKDLIAQLSARVFEPFIWADVQERYEMNAVQKGILHESADAGLRSGGTTPLTSSTFEKAFLSVSAYLNRRDFTTLYNERKHEIHLMGMYSHEKILSFQLDEALPAGITLTPREAEILTWCAQGKSSIETGIILNISHYTVKEILNNVRLKLNCINTAQAVAIATYHRLIVPLESGIVMRQSTPSIGG